MTYKAYIFDLDGTLLDTLPDLVRLTNMVLEERAWPKRTRDEILSYVGSGGLSLLRKAAPAEASDEEVESAFARWQQLYPQYGHALTRPYDGIPETLARLKAAGAKLGVLSNKFDSAVGQVIEEHFPDVFDIARGECAEIPRKPDPTGLRFMMRSLGVLPEDTLYIGDSASDVETARRAGAANMAVLWGYRTREQLAEACPDAYAEAPSDIA